MLDGNKAKFVEVTTGIIGESDRQIISGLKEGDEVITGPSRVLNTLKEGAIVKKQTKKEGESCEQDLRMYSFMDEENGNASGEAARTSERARS